MTHNRLIYDCPACGQGGLEIVRIKSSSPRDAIVCSECDRIWLTPEKVGLRNDETVEIALPRLGVEPSWLNLQRISKGVAWEQLDAHYQAILSTKGLA